ncbi:MAG: DegV family protein [Lachnospiraceae bacterium]|nr:DegV family protein [Lachnospiraceae bacterium]
MKQYQIISDGSCDLPEELVEETGIDVIPFYVSFDDKTYQKEIQEIGIRDFYQKMVDFPGVYPKSSMPSVTDFMDAFVKYAKENVPVICICITTKFSGSMQSAVNARDMTLEKYPRAQITVINSTINTVLQGLYVLEAVKMQAAGVSYEKTIERLEAIKSTGRIFFTVGNMEYLKHGGRIGQLTALAGSVLGIRPIITLKEGEIFSSGISRSRKKSMQKSLDLLLDYIKASKEPVDHFSITIGFGYDYEEALGFRELAVEQLKKLDDTFTEEKLPIRQIGATISVHTGPYPIGFAIVKKWDM